MVSRVGRTAIGLVLIFMVCAFILMIWLQNENPEDDDGSISYEVTRTGINPRTIDDEVYWDITYTVSGETSHYYRLYSEVDILITDKDGNELYNNESFKLNDPMRYDNASDGNVDVEVWYIDGTDARLMNKGDTIIFTGLTPRFEGATVRLYQPAPYIGEPPVVEFKLPKSFD